MAKRKLGGLGKGLDSLFEDLPMTEDASPDLTRLPVREDHIQSRFAIGRA